MKCWTPHPFHRRALELHDERDGLGRGKVLGQLGLVAYERFKEARTANKPKAELVRHLNDAEQFYLQALELTPPNAVDFLAMMHGSLGNICGDAGDIERSVEHCREAARYFEAGEDVYLAAQTRFNVAVTLAQAGAAGGRAGVCARGSAEL